MSIRTPQSNRVSKTLVMLHSLGIVGISMLVCASVGFAQPKKPIPKKLIVATRHVPPFAMKNKTGQWEGLSIDLLREFKADLEHGSDHETELIFREMGLEEMLTATERGEVDMAVAALTVNYQREKRMDFTHPFHQSGIGIAVAVHSSKWTAILSIIFSTTFLSIVLGLLCALFLSGVAVYFFERRKNREQFGGGAIRGIAAGLWWAAVTLTTVGYGDKAPKTAPGRFMGVIWMFTGLFIIAGFTATVTSALTVKQFKSGINGPADLSRVRVATVKSSTSLTYLRSRHIIAKTFDDVHDALTMLKKGKIDAVVYDAPILRYETHLYFSAEIRVLPTVFEQQDYAIALPSESPWRERFNRVLLRKIASPEWKNVLADYFGERFE